MSGDERSYVTIRGLNSSFEKVLELLEHLLANAKAEEQAYAEYLNRILKDRQEKKAETNTILWEAMFNYGIYGADNPHKFLLSEDELKAVDSGHLTQLIKDLASFKHNVFYFGTAEITAVKKEIATKHIIPKELKEMIEPKRFAKPITESNKVYVVDFDISQANILLVSKDVVFSKELIPLSRVYGEYYGSGLSSVVFQEIRESKALAYSAYSGYRLGDKPGRRNSLLGFLGTQSNKLSIATETLIALMNEMPMAKAQ